MIAHEDRCIEFAHHVLKATLTRMALGFQFTGGTFSGPEVAEYLVAGVATLEEMKRMRKDGLLAWCADCGTNPAMYQVTASWGGTIRICETCGERFRALGNKLEALT